MEAAGPAFFVSAWLLMLFAGTVDTEVGIRPFGYLTSMVVTIAPMAGARVSHSAIVTTIDVR